jgi:hypothetical protein
MNKLSSVLLGAVGIVLATSNESHAFGLPCCDVNVCCAEKTITCYRPEMRCREVQCTVMKKVCREVVEMKKVVIAIPYTEMQKRDVYVYREVPEEVEREIYVAVECPTCETGCGCGHCCKPNPANYKTTVKCCECKPKPFKVEICEPVCKVRTEEKLVPCKKVVVDEVAETITKKEYYCEMVPFTVKVPVPVCVPSCKCGH